MVLCYNLGMYIEFVIAENFVLTYFAGMAAVRLAHNKLRRWRASVAAFLGTAVAVCYPLLPDNIGIQLAVKLALWIALCVIMYVKTPRFLLQSLMFLGCTFAFGGASYAVSLVICSGGGRVAEVLRECPVTVTLGSGCVAYACIGYIIRRMRVPRARAPYEYGTEINVFGGKLTFRAFLDTGNCVFDEKTGLPVVITDIERFTQKLNGAAAVEFAKKLPSLRKISASTPAGSTDIYIVEPKEITVYSDRQGHKINAMVGLIGAGRFTSSHEMLIGPNVLTEGV